MTVEAEPVPWMVTLSVMSRSPVCPAVSPDPGIVSLYVPAGTTIVLGPGVALDWMIASRSERSPGTALASFSSVVVFTVKVEQQSPRLEHLEPEGSCPIRTGGCGATAASRHGFSSRMSDDQIEDNR